MTPRDSRGRFVSQREAAATLLLEAALAEGLRMLRGPRPPRVFATWDGRAFPSDAPLDVADRLAEATRCADLLLDGAA